MKRRGIRKAVVVSALAVLCGCRRQETDSEKLLALAPRSERPINARLTGFDWQEARVQRGPHTNLLDPSRLELAGAASAVIQSRANDPSPRARHEAGTAYLLIERDRDAIDALESAVRQSPKDAAYWSDLAAARYTLAVREKRPHELPQALADADHALHLQPALPDALFNRALIIESLGVTEAARRAWQRYVAADPSTHWSIEAMHHLGNLRVVTTRDEFQHHLAVASEAFHHGNEAPLVALARNYPQESRTWSEGPLLATWADAVRKNDTKTAAETLSIVRKLGAELVGFNGVHTVADIVAAIDRAAATGMRTLADAHAVYRDGRVLYSQRHVKDAQAHLRRAQELFDRGGSPMALLTDYYVANCLYDSNKPAEANQALDNLLTRFDKNRYPALAAEIGWERSLCYGSVGQWDAVVRTASASRKTFAQLGETQDRAEMDMLIAGGLSHASQPAAAWKARIAAFPVLSAGGSSDRIQSSLISAMNAEAAQGQMESALALARIALDELRHTNQPVSISIAESARAEFLANIGDVTAAQRAIERARLSAKAVRDAELQRRTGAAINIAEAVVARGNNPHTSLQLLDSAISFYKSGHGNAWLPKAYLERGRTHVRVGDDSAALADFQAGVHEVDAQRSGISDKELRGTFYDTAPELFTDAISLLLRRGHSARAFEFSDSARGRSVYEQISKRGKAAQGEPTVSQLQRELPAGTTLLEYVLLRDSVIIFHISSSRAGFVRVAVALPALRASVERYNDSLQQRRDVASVRLASAALYRLLIAPIAPEIEIATHLVIVPDRQLHGAPFAALYDGRRGRYLVEQLSISVAPSAGAVLEAHAAQTLSPVLVVGDPNGASTPALEESAHEAEAIAAMYDSSTLLTGDRATRARFIAAAHRSGLIHYAGHADSDSADPFGALRLAADRPLGSGDLDTDAIAGLDLRSAPLVILAACGSMRGDSAHVEGMPSIARAFLAAGARNVIGTLWEVDDDAVAPLFRQIHRGLRGGSSASDALRNAQIALAHDADPRLSHPATWAPVELLGYSSGPSTTRAKRSQ